MAVDVACDTIVHIFPSNNWVQVPDTLASWPLQSPTAWGMDFLRMEMIIISSSYSACSQQRGLTMRTTMPDAASC